MKDWPHSVDSPNDTPENAGIVPTREDRAVHPSSSPASMDMDQPHLAPTSESLFSLLREIQSLMASLRRLRSFSPLSQGKQVLIEEAPAAPPLTQVAPMSGPFPSSYNIP